MSKPQAKVVRRDGNLKDFFASCWKNKDAVRFFRLTKIESSTGYEIKAAKDEPALQAADIAAYEFNKIAPHSLENNYEIDETSLRKSVLNLCREPNNNAPLSTGRGSHGSSVRCDGGF
jgi:hypothetical protein